ncbi:Pepco domain-containing protein, partial [Streptomyces boluensis]
LPTLPFWVSVDGEEAEDGDTMGLFSRDGDAVLRQVPLGPLRKNLSDTVDALQQLFADADARGGTLPLAEAQLNFQVTASGGIQLIGSGQVQGTRGLTLVFKRPA